MKHFHRYVEQSIWMGSVWLIAHLNSAIPVAWVELLAYLGRCNVLFCPNRILANGAGNPTSVWSVTAEEVSTGNNDLKEVTVLSFEVLMLVREWKSYLEKYVRKLNIYSKAEHYHGTWYISLSRLILIWNIIKDEMVKYITILPIIGVLI